MPKLNVAFDKAELAHLQKVLKQGGLAVHGVPMRKLFRSGSRLITQQARQRAPIRTGETVTVMRDLYGDTGIKPWGIGRVAVTTKQGAILNNGGRGRMARYQSTARKGKLTKGWFSGTLRLAAVRRGIDDLARQAVAEMGRRWTRG